MRIQRWMIWSGVCLLSGIPAIPLGAVRAIAQSANFGTLTLRAGKTSGTMTGSTGGTTSLPAIVSNRDRAGNRCPGFGDPAPDHILELQQPFSKLTLTVTSGIDTTLIVSGPGGVRCSDDSGVGKDARLEDTNWFAGKYQVWVGTIEPKQKRDYRLSVQAK